MATLGDTDDRDDNPPSIPTRPVASDWASQLEDAIRNHCLEDLQRLLDSGNSTIEVALKYSFEENENITELDLTPLALAIALGEDSIIETLLNYDSHIDAELPVIGGTVLHLAARYGSKAITTLLLSRVADLNQTDNGGNTALYLASRYGREEVISCLLEHGADYTLRNNDGHLPYQVAAMYGQVESLKTLFDHSSYDQVNEANQGLNAPLHLAAINDRTQAIEWLLDHGAAIDQPGESGLTPLAVACLQGSTESARLLLKRGADVHKQNVFLNTPILFASLNGNLELYKLLVSHGALPSDVDANGNTCYHKVILSEGTGQKTEERFSTSCLAWAWTSTRQTHLGFRLCSWPVRNRRRSMLNTSSTWVPMSTSEQLAQVLPLLWRLPAIPTPPLFSDFWRKAPTQQRQILMD